MVLGRHLIVYHSSLSDLTQTLGLGDLFSILRKDWIGAKLVGRADCRVSVTKYGGYYWGWGRVYLAHINGPSLGKTSCTGVSLTDHVCTRGLCSD